jgi:hypothetical protein
MKIQVEKQFGMKGVTPGIYLTPTKDGRAR